MPPPVRPLAGSAPGAHAMPCDRVPFHPPPCCASSHLHGVPSIHLLLLPRAHVYSGCSRPRRPSIFQPGHSSLAALIYLTPHHRTTKKVAPPFRIFGPGRKCCFLCFAIVPCAAPQSHQPCCSPPSPLNQIHTSTAVGRIPPLLFEPPTPPDTDLCPSSPPLPPTLLHGTLQTLASLSLPLSNPPRLGALFLGRGGNRTMPDDFAFISSPTPSPFSLSLSFPFLLSLPRLEWRHAFTIISVPQKKRPQPSADALLCHAPRRTHPARGAPLHPVCVARAVRGKSALSLFFKSFVRSSLPPPPDYCCCSSSVSQSSCHVFTCCQPASRICFCQPFVSSLLVCPTL